MIKPELLEILCCPQCRADVQYDESSETLKCISCGRIYPVKEGIPIMLVDEGEKSGPHHD